MIQIKRTDTGVAVQSPYHEDFVRAARSLGGKWDKPFWHFDSRDSARVEQLLETIYVVKRRHLTPKHPRESTRCGADRR